MIINKRIKALSLIEVSIGLVIMGLLVYGALKGWKWVESTKLNNTISQVVQIQSSLQSYTQTHHKKPDAQNFWKELQYHGGPEPTQENTVISSIGATFRIVGSNIVLTPLTAQQAFHIKNSLDRNPDLDTGWIKVQDTSSADQKKVDMQDTKYNYQVSLSI